MARLGGAFCTTGGGTGVAVGGAVGGAVCCGIEALTKQASERDARGVNMVIMAVLRNFNS
jgi:hypothetical protein